jgi:hypothetical protein
MKIKILVVLLLLLLPIPAHANDWRNLNALAERSGFDDTIHFAVGAGVSYLVKKHLGLKGWQANVAAIAIPLAIGLIKEATDKNFNLFDVAGYGAGAGIVVLTF